MNEQQIDFLERNKHFVFAELLSDGDALVLDENNTPNRPFGPYILTKDCKVQDVSYHYQLYHWKDFPRR